MKKATAILTALFITIMSAAACSSPTSPDYDIAGDSYDIAGDSYDIAGNS